MLHTPWHCRLCRAVIHLLPLLPGLLPLDRSLAATRGGLNG